MDKVILLVHLFCFVIICSAPRKGGDGKEDTSISACSGVVYNDVCYWTEDDSIPCTDGGGELAVVQDNTTWHYLITALDSSLRTYSSLKLGLQPEPTNNSLSQIYSIDGGNVVILGCFIEETEEFCFSWNIEKDYIEGADCKLGKYHTLCELYEENNCVLYNNFQVNGRCYFVKTSPNQLSTSLSECRKQNGSLPVFTSYEELDWIRSALIEHLKEQSENAVWIGLTKHPNYWRTLNLTEMPFLYFNDFDDQIQGNNLTATQASYFKGCIVFQSLHVGFKRHDCLSNTAKIVCQTSNITNCLGVVIDGSCFWNYQGNNEHFFQASIICSNYSSQLPVPKNFQELVAIASLASDEVWIGATISPWFTVLGEAIPWFDWKYGSVDDFHGNCVEIGKDNLMWKTRKCGENRVGALCLGYNKGGPKCKLDWENHCFWLISPLKDFTAMDAQAECEKDKGFLAPITSVEMATYIKNSFTFNDGRYWIGIVRWNRRWFSSAGEQKWFNWGIGGNPAFSEESCVSFSESDNYKWLVGCKTSRGHGHFCMKKMTFDNSTSSCDSPLTTDMTITNLGTSPTTELYSTASDDNNMSDVTISDHTDITSGLDGVTSELAIKTATTEEMTTTTEMAKTTEMTTTTEMAKTTEMDTTTEMAKTTEMDTTGEIDTKVEMTTAQMATREESTLSTINITAITFNVKLSTETKQSSKDTTQVFDEVTTTTAKLEKTGTDGTTMESQVTTVSPLSSSSKQFINQTPIITSLKKCGVQVTYPSTDRVWKIPCLCGCRNCLKPEKESDLQAIHEFKETIKKNLSVPLDQISRQIYKKISMPDKRPSATSMGIISTSVILIFSLILIFFDIIKIAFTVKNLWTSGGDESYLR